MKKALAILLVIILPLIAFAVSAGAALPPVEFGDVNGDFSADVLDVTLIQRYLAELEVFSYEKEIRADFDHDGSVTSIDATWIQRSDAEMNIPEGYGGEGSQNINVTSLYADYDSGKAAVGVPVTFTALTNGGDGCTYEFYIGSELIRERSENNTFTYTFTESGFYNVHVWAYNKYGFRTHTNYQFFNINNYHSNTDYEVVDSYPYDTLGLVGVSWIDYMYSDIPGLEIHACGGTAPYQYSFTIPDMTQGNKYYGTDIEGYNNTEDKYGWELLYDENYSPYLYHDFSEENTVWIPLSMFAPRSEHAIIVQAKDASGNLTETRTLYFNDEILEG